MGRDRQPGWYVHLLAPGDVSQLDSKALLRDIMTSPATDQAAIVVAEGSRLVLKHQRTSGEPFQFVRAMAAPSCALIDRMAAERFPDGCDAAIAWRVDSAIMFVVAWDDHRSEALPLGGMGQAAWTPLDEQLARLRDVEVARPSDAV